MGEGVAFGMGANVTLQDNTLSTNERNGVLFLDGALGRIEDNVFIENQRYGIFEFCAPDFVENAVVIQQNTFTGNGLGEEQLCGE